MKTRPPRKEKKPIEKKSEIAHYNAILLEEMRGEFKAVAEAVEFTRESLGEKIDSLETRIGSLETRVDSLEFQVVSVKTEVSGLSTKVDKIAVKLDKHDEEIGHLKKAQNLG